MVHGLEEDWPRLLGIQRIQRVEVSGHYIHQETPDIAVKEILSLINNLLAIR